MHHLSKKSDLESSHGPSLASKLSMTLKIQFKRSAGYMANPSCIFCLVV